MAMTSAVPVALRSQRSLRRLPTRGVMLCRAMSSGFSSTRISTLGWGESTAGAVRVKVLQIVECDGQARFLASSMNWRCPLRTGFPEFRCVRSGENEGRSTPTRSWRVSIAELDAAEQAGPPHPTAEAIDLLDTRCLT